MGKNISVYEGKIEEYKTFLLQEEKSKATIEKYIREIKELFLYIGDEDVTKEKMLGYREFMMEKFCAKTVNTKLAAINSYLAFAGMSQYRVKFLKVQKKAFVKEEKELSEKEYRKLLKTAKENKKERLYHLLLTIGSTGIRVSEVRFITVQALKTGRVQIHMKGKEREILLSKKLIIKLRKYVKNACIKCGAIFCTRSGKPMDRSNICHEMKALGKLAGVDKRKIFPHNLRHLFARSFYRVEKNLGLLADILGHSSIETTRIYIAASVTIHERILRKMNLII